MLSKTGVHTSSNPTSGPRQSRSEGRVIALLMVSKQQSDTQSRFLDRNAHKATSPKAVRAVEMRGLYFLAELNEFRNLGKGLKR